MDENMSRMSKYQRKQLAKRRGTWNQPEAQVALSIIANFERRDAQKCTPQPPKAKKPKQAPPPPMGLIHPLGDLPERVAEAMDAALQNLCTARDLCVEAYNAAGRGRKQAECLSIIGFIDAQVMRLAGVAGRAGKIPNAPKAGEETATA